MVNQINADSGIRLRSSNFQRLGSAEDLTLRPFFARTSDLAQYAKSIVPRCLTPKKRLRFELQPQSPPLWCIEMKKWPYATPEWNTWLAETKAGKNVNMPAVPGDQ